MLTVQPIWRRAMPLARPPMPPPIMIAWGWLDIDVLQSAEGLKTADRVSPVTNTSTAVARVTCNLPAAAWYFHFTVCHFSARSAEKWHTKEERYDSAEG